MNVFLTTTADVNGTLGNPFGFLECTPGKDLVDPVRTVKRVFAAAVEVGFFGGEKRNIGGEERC